jgi:hypothetical protein
MFSVKYRPGLPLSGLCRETKGYQIFEKQNINIASMTPGVWAKSGASSLNNFKL